MTEQKKWTPEDVAERCTALYTEMGKVIAGQEIILEHIMISLLSRGHVLIIGLPGLAKTLIAKTFAACTHLHFSRIQFTPDMMPSDVTGVEILEEDVSTGRRIPRFMPGPIFAHVILADEINRTPPRTQAAMLQVMQENEVTIGQRTLQVEKPFLVIATQNPIEQEGTYPLPEAQLDRFMMKLNITYPSYEQEVRMLRETTAPTTAAVTPVLSKEEILSLQEMTRAVPVADDIYELAVHAVRATRPDSPDAIESVRTYVRWGASPRACQYIILAAKARALMRGNACVDREDIAAVTPPVLCHRILLNYQARAEDVQVESIVEDIIAQRVRTTGA